MADPNTPSDTTRETPSDTTRDWKAAFRESGALGWIGMALLVAVIVASTLVFGGANEKVANSQPPNAQVTR